MILPSPTTSTALQQTFRGAAGSVITASSSSSLAATILSQSSITLSSSPTTTTTTTTTLLTTFLIRGGVELFAPPSVGGGAAAAALDLGRVRMRLEGIQLYATLTALLTNSCLRLYSSVKAQQQQKPPTSTSTSSKMESMAMDLFYLCTTFSILSGSYTTIVFGLLSLYSKTALGRGLDKPFLEFWAATCEIRESALETFLACLVSFEIAFILSLFIKFKGRRRILFVLFGFLLSAYSFRRWTKIMILASKLLFPLRAETQF